MKNKLIKLSFLLLCAVCSVTNVWGWNITSGQVYYFKRSASWNQGNERYAVAFGDGDNTYYWYSCQQVPGESDVFYAVSNGNYNWMIFCRMNGSTTDNKWDNRWNECDKVQPNNNYNKFDMTGDWGGGFNWYKYAPPMASAILTNNTSIYGGDGSSANPYQVKVGSTLSVTASATSSVPADNQTKYYQFYKKENSGNRTAWGTESSSTITKTLTVGAAGTTYAIDVEARNEYYTTYGTKATSSVMYFVAVDPIYAILGDFNSWTHSAATWDLVDKGSNNWDATFNLDKGTYKFKVVYNSSYYGKASTSITRSSTSASELSTSGGDGANISITADVTGSYTFRFNSSSKDLTVYYPTAYTVKFGYGTGGSSVTASATSAGGSFSSGAYVASGDEVTFSQTAATGYTFKGWYTSSTGSTSAGVSNNKLTINGAKTVYAQYTPNDYEITLAKNGGSANGTVTATYNSTATKSFTAVTRTGYDCTGYWTSTSGGNKVVKADGTLVSYSSSVSSYLNTNGTWKKTTSTTLNAQWTAQTYTADNNLNKTTGSTNGKYTATYDATSITINTTPTKTGYHVDGYYKEYSSGTYTTLVATSAGALQASTGYTDASKKWNVTSNQTLYTKWAANTYTIAFNANDDNYVGTATGSTASINATYGTSYTLTTNGFSREGYTFAGWTRNADGTGTPYTDGQTGVSNLTSTNGGTVTLYAKWTPKTYTVTLNAREGTCATKNTVVTMGSTYGAGTAGPLPSPTPPAGKVFSGWYTSAGGGTKVESSTLVATPSDHTLYAHYAEKAQVYFKNTIGWSQVWVTYDANWDGTQGTGNQGKTYHRMNLVPGTTDVYYDDIPDEYLTSWRWNIAFNNLDYSSTPFYAFDNGEAVFRYDFDKNATMFVPTSNTGTSADGNYTKNGVQYRSTGYSEESSGPKYTSGYWRTYNNTYSGYTMTYQKSGGSWSSGHKMESSNVSDNVFIYTVHMDANSQYNFAFYKERDVNTKSVQFRYGSQITSSACTNLKLVCDPQNSWMKTTVEGDYVFKLEMKNDGHMYLTVEYPFKANDYKVIYSYNKGGAKTYNSEIIRAAAGTNETISVFIHSSSDASSRSLQIAKCTGVNSSGVATWNNSYATIDIASIKESGVYNFIITQNGSAAATGAYWNKYTGNYYIRTDVSDGGWDMYKYRPDNIMTLSEYSLTQTLSEPYSHYYCRFIESTDMDITYAVATDYSPNISGKLVGDATIGGVDKTKLPASANVRFTYNEKTNALRRAYLKNAQGGGNTRFLVLHGRDSKIFNTNGSAITADAGKSLTANELLFEDLGNWIYQVELQAQPTANISLIADYNSADRYLIGSTSSGLTIMGGSGDTKYDILAVYDFKTNRLMTVWKPSDDIKETLTDVDVLLIRHAQDAGKSITFNGGSLTTKKVYGALEFRYNELVGCVANWNSESRPKLKFFISFPFDVNVSDIFGLNSAYGDAYVIEEYDGVERASKGFFRGDGTTTFWKELKAGDVMKANVGYSVIMDNDYLNNDMGHVWDNKSAGSKVYLYFPSVGDVGSIASESVTINIPEHKCEIDRTFTSKQADGRELNHKNTDSNWNMMGVPIFDNHSDNGTTGQPGAVFAESGNPWDTGMNYFYEWNPSDNQYAIHTAKNYQFKSMHGYMVQYHGDVTFKTAATPATVAARRAQDMKEYQLELQVLDSDAEVLNRTYVELRENACDTFALNEDVYMTYNNYAVNVYTLAGNYDVAANVLSVDNHVIPVGVEVNKAGTYTFSMPSNFSGKVTLIDNFTGEHTDLSISDYEVELPKSVIEDRFMLEINIEKVTTAIDGINGEGTLKDGKAHKFLQNGIMYILQNGILYDAQGKRVQ